MRYRIILDLFAFRVLRRGITFRNRSRALYYKRIRRRGAPTGRFLRTNDSLRVVMQIHLDSPFSKPMRASDIDARARAGPTFQMLSSAQRSSVTREPLRGHVGNEGVVSFARHERANGRKTKGAGDLV